MHYSRSDYEKHFLLRDLSVTNEIISHITDRGLMYSTKVPEWSSSLRKEGT